MFKRVYTSVVTIVLISVCALYLISNIVAMQENIRNNGTSGWPGNGFRHDLPVGQTYTTGLDNGTFALWVGILLLLLFLPNFVDYSERQAEAKRASLPQVKMPWQVRVLIGIYLIFVTLLQFVATYFLLLMYSEWVFLVALAFVIALHFVSVRRVYARSLVPWKSIIACLCVSVAYILLPFGIVILLAI